MHVVKLYAYIYTTYIYASLKKMKSEVSRMNQHRASLHQHKHIFISNNIICWKNRTNTFALVMDFV